MNFSYFLYVLFVFLYFILPGDCITKEILISNNKIDANTTDIDFYENLSEAFSNITEKYPNSTSEDIFIFKLYPSNKSYIINANENNNSQIFKNFSGQIFIENQDEQYIPTIELRTTMFVFNILSSLTLKGITIDGNGVHANNETFCEGRSPCCNFSSYSDGSAENLCFLQGKSFPSLPEGSFKGLFQLQGNYSKLFLENVTIQNFYATKNYFSLIYDEYLNSNIYLNYLLIDNVFFIDGIIYYFNSNDFFISEFNFQSTNLTVFQWNYFDISIENIDSELATIAGSEDKQFLFFFKKAENLKFNCSSINVAKSDFFFLLNQANALIDEIEIKYFSGIFVSLVSCNQFYITKILMELSGNNITHYLFKADSSNIIASSGILRNIFAYCFDFQSYNNVEINDFSIDNINIPFEETEGYVLFFSREFNYIYFENFSISNILILNSAIGFVNYDAFTTFQKNLTMKNCNFNNINIVSGYNSVFIYTNRFYIDNSVFHNITCPNSIFRNIAPYSTLMINKGLIFNITGGTSGPISIAAFPLSCFVLDNSTFMQLNAGKFVFSGVSGEINITLYNVRMEYIFFEIGYLFLLQTNQNLNIKNSSFSNIYYSTPSTFDGIVLSNGGTIGLESTIFRLIQIPFGTGDIVFAHDSIISVNTTTFENNYLFGKGGVRAWNNSGIYILNSVFQSLVNEKQGIFQFFDSGIVQINSSKFLNITSFKYTLFLINNFESLVVVDCYFEEITSNFDSAFSITNELTSFNSNNSVFFSDCVFQDSTQINNGVLNFNWVYLPIEIINCFFNVSYSENGGFIYLLNVTNISVVNTSFFSSKVVYFGGVIFMMNAQNSLFNNCFFLENYMVNGEQGGNFYIENSNITIENVKFQGYNYLNESLILNQKGSVISAFLQVENIVFQVSNCKIYNFNQSFELIHIDSKNILEFNLENLLVDEIYSSKGNSILSCSNCKLNIENLVVSNSFAMLNLIEITSSTSSNEFSLYNFSFSSNSFRENGHFLSVQNLNSINLENGEFIANFYCNSFLSLQNITTINLFNISIYQNQIDIASQMTSSHLFLNIIEGKLVYLNNIRFNKTDLCFLSAQCQMIIINEMKIENISNGESDNFIEIQASDTLNISNVSISNSNLGRIHGYSKLINLDHTSLKAVKCVYSKQPALYFFEYNNNEGDIFIDTFESNNISMTSLMKVSFFNSLKIQNFNQINEGLSVSIGLNLRNINDIQINDLNLTNLNDNGIIILSDNTPSQISKINIVNSNIFSCGNFANSIGAAINITGNSDIIFDRVKFNYNKALKWSILVFYSWNNESSIKLNDCKFFGNEEKNSINASIIVPNNEIFYENFIEDQKALIYVENLKFSSFPVKIKTTINGVEYIEGSIIEIYSGEEIYIQLICLDHFNQTLSTLTNYRIAITSENESIALINNETFFFNGQAELPKFTLLIPPENISNSSFNLEIDYSNLNKVPLQNFPMKIKVHIKECDEGRIILSSNYCLACSDNTYSFDKKPSKDTICRSCPENAKCYSNAIVPNDGYWNFDRKSEKIIKCMIQESCSLVFINETTNQTCSEGYYGNICNECQPNFGKLVSRKCKKCDESEIPLHIFFLILKIFVMSPLIFIQYRLSLLDTQKNRFLMSLLNIFLQHTLLYSIFLGFQESYSESEETIYHLQNVLTFNENCVFLIYCMFPDISKISLYYIVFFYFVILVFIQLCFVIGLSIIYKYFGKGKEENNLFYLLCLTLYDNSIVFLQYFLGLICPLSMNDDNSFFSAKLTELTYNDSHYFILLFALSLPVLIICILCGLLFINNKSKIPTFIFLDCEYIKQFEKLSIFSIFIIIISIIFNNYIPLVKGNSIIMKNILITQFLLLLIFTTINDRILQLFKSMSLFILIAYFSFDFYATFSLNWIFYGLLMGYVVFFLKSKV